MPLKLLEISRCADCPHHYMAHLNEKWRLQCRMQKDGGVHDDPYSIPANCPLPDAPEGGGALGWTDEEPLDRNEPGVEYVRADAPEGETDPYETEEYATFVASMAKYCHCTHGPCDGVLAGGPCDNITIDEGEPDDDE